MKLKPTKISSLFGGNNDVKTVAEQRKEILEEIEKIKEEKIADKKVF